VFEVIEPARLGYFLEWLARLGEQGLGADYYAAATSSSLALAGAMADSLLSPSFKKGRITNDQ
jgi:hypothetical protein